MTFDLLHNDTDCDCRQDTKQDTLNLYVRKIEKPVLKDKDLRTHWERGKRPDSANCVKVCGYKGMSVNIWDESSKQSIFSKFLTTFRFAPGNRKDSVFVFKFKENAGLLRYTPEDNDLFHYDFYKCDTFTSGMLDSVEIIPLKDILTNEERGQQT